MNCPVCNEPIRKVSWHITSNRKEGDGYKEHDKTKYRCEKDDAWVETEIPAGK